MACWCAPARANLVITPVFDPTITSDPNAATIEATIDTALGNFEADLANPVTVTIDFGEMDGGLGSSATYQYDLAYSDYLSLLEDNQNLSSADITALTSLGVTAPFTDPNPTTNPVNGSTTIQTTGALLRALGVDALPPTGQPDGFVDFNAALVDDATGTPAFYQYSLESVISHEVDEVLGVGGGGSQLNAVYEGYTSATGAVGPLDLFRYSGVGTRSYTTDAGADPYFSIDGGQTNLDYFNQTGANGSDFGDWGNGVTGAEYGNTPPQVQDAYGTPGTSVSLGSSELTALDVVGWDLTPQGAPVGAVPEPESVWLLLGGLIAMGIWRRGKRAFA
jgi:hypothetical protein